MNDDAFDDDVLNATIGRLEVQVASLKGNYNIGGGHALSAGSVRFRNCTTTSLARKSGGQIRAR